MPKKEHAAPEWQAAMQALILVAGGGGPTMFARIGIMRALKRQNVPEFNPKGERTALGPAQAEKGSMVSAKGNSASIAACSRPRPHDFHLLSASIYRYCITI
ncbi:hypothetical protein [Bradyrhizobium sp. 131]|uniref:hypothetical protein n=1 Tax=Bradyrhizobium sp. 131 TaxID=2782609 RepID=UPI0031F9BC3E